jgi:pyruvate dehydrogenase E1 component alpha subunit
VFVCENNGYAESTPAWQHMPIEDLSNRAVAYGMHTIVVDGQDVEAVHAAAHEAMAFARGGEGPVFLLANTYRLTGHYVGDPQVYRPKEELREVRQKHDPLDRLREHLGVSDDEWSAFEREVAAIVEGSVEFARNGTDPRPEDALKNVYA